MYGFDGMKHVIQNKAVTFCLLVLTTAGCQMPNVQPFAEATAQLRQAVITTGNLTLTAMRATPYPDDKGQVIPLNSTNHPTNRLANAWAIRTRAMDALVNYSDSLAQVVAAGQSAEKTAANLVNSVSNIADTMTGGEGFSDEAGALAMLIIKNGGQLKAAHAVDQAVTAAHPTVAGIGRIVKKDLNSLAIQFDSEYVDILGNIDGEYGEHKTYRMNLIKKVTVARVEMLQADFDDESVAEVNKIEKLLAATEKDHQEFKAKLQAAKTERQEGQRAFATAINAVDFWIAAHQELHLAIRENRRPNVQLLLTAIQEVKIAVDNVRES
jgi:hypothetical protein